MVSRAAPGSNTRGLAMFFARKKLYETVTAVMAFLIPVGVFVLLNQHVPIWAAAGGAGAVLAASIWSAP
jgi:hypothetical protein